MLKENISIEKVFFQSLTMAVGVFLCYAVMLLLIYCEIHCFSIFPLAPKPFS